ncbi:hypothetical protein SAMN05442782_8864 [Streptomyces sp. OK228]|nr:hypothetical protein SAMN05442782_8864 [Streptomyces sp. OK228]
MRGDAFDAGRAARTAGGRGGHAVQVGHRFVVQSRGSCDGFEYLLGRVAFAALFQAHVVVGAHTRERGDLFAAQTGHPAAAGRGKSRGFGAQLGTPCAEESSQRVLGGGVLVCAHVSRVHMSRVHMPRLGLCGALARG